MGIMDQIKEGLGKADEKIESVVDGGKAELEIKKQEAAISETVLSLGKKMLEYFDSGKTVDDSEIMGLYKKIADSRGLIEDLKKKL